jgi:TetR/AcrR family transcriptional regulator
MPQRSTRDPERTRRRVINAAAKEFSLRGFDGTSLSAVARRAKVSKQLIAHHFGTKERLFEQVHEEKFRPRAHWSETLPENPAHLLAARFQRRADDLEYIRFLTWEAASMRNSTIPGRRERQERISEYGEAIRQMQEKGLLPGEYDYRFIQLAALSLATYPIAFGPITRMVTGRDGTDPSFQRDWMAFLERIGERLFPADGAPARSPDQPVRGRKTAMVP